MPESAFAADAVTSARNHVILRLRVALEPDQALPKRSVEKELGPGVILWNKPNGKEITNCHGKIKALWDKHLAEIRFYNGGHDRC